MDKSLGRESIEWGVPVPSGRDFALTVPRFHIRTLMIGVAVAGLESAMLVACPIYGAVLLGPLIGLAFGSQARHPILGFLWGGMAGGLVGFLLLILLGADGPARIWADRAFGLAVLTIIAACIPCVALGMACMLFLYV